MENVEQFFSKIQPVFESLNYEDQAKPKAQVINEAKAAILEDLKAQGYTISSDIKDNAERLFIENEKGVPVYVDYELLTLDKYVKSVLRDKRISYGTEADGIESLRREVLDLKDKLIPKHNSKFVERINHIIGETQSNMIRNGISPEDLAKGIQERNRAAEQEIALRQERLSQENKDKFVKSNPL